MSIKKKQLILVDHNERSQAVDNIEEAEILEILDHHRIGSLETFQPIMFRNQPVGCTATIMYEIYAEKYLEIPENIAGLLCAAILSDTLMFRSPTCTERDKEAAQELAKIAKIEIESFANKMFRAGSNLSSKTPEEIFYQDYKKFIVDDLAFGVGQISFMSEEELADGQRPPDAVYGKRMWQTWNQDGVLHADQHHQGVHGTSVLWRGIGWTGI